ncbi:glycoside hydrolase family 2 protein [Robinsoniella peoriensis]|uniref:glycoside hydrolase family 2 protein n=1 Tax=Robinsoniella peoriensis TaxID=180332 RepID=UPI0036307BCD
MNITKLNKSWVLHEAPFSWDRQYLADINKINEGWYKCDLPVDVRMPLIDAGVIKEPLEGDNSYESKWIEERSWWFQKHFSSADIGMENEVIELVLEGLDTNSDIFLNDQYIGSHQNVHYPFICEIKRFLVNGDNKLSVRLTSGLENISIKDLAEIDCAVTAESDFNDSDRGDHRRTMVRRPQYNIGWDWGPRLVSVGITGQAFVRAYNKIAIREVGIETKEIKKDGDGKLALLNVMVNAENLNIVDTVDCDLEIVIRKDGKIAACKTIPDILLTSGTNYINQELEIQEAELWWPAGYGEQPLYQVEITARCADTNESWPVFNYGIRKISIDTPVLEDGTRNFKFIVNGQEIFCKGANWIPNDFIYARVTAEKYRTLLEEAVEANFNMIRIWGGGLYERELFYDLCDEKGILVWQDFMLACGAYPEQQAWFENEIRSEYAYQAKRLRTHSCIALFCGTNENHWIFSNPEFLDRWKIKPSYQNQYGLWIPNVLSKEVVWMNCPYIPYWNSSPYGGKNANDLDCGDAHLWSHGFVSNDIREALDLKSYDAIKTKFVSEYGVLGPCCLESIREYLGDGDLDMNGKLWKSHTNVTMKDTLGKAIVQNYLPENHELTESEFILYGGLVQGDVYEYSLESFRFQEDCGGALFWMYNDAWGEVGWTVIDYYLRRKISYYGVKRAFAHKKFIIRQADDCILIRGINDTKEKLRCKVKFGYVSFDGKISDTREMVFEVPAGSRMQVLKEKLGDYDLECGSYMLYVYDDGIDHAMLYTCPNSRLKYAKSPVEVMEEKVIGNDKKLVLRAGGYVCGVYIAGNYKCSDNYFNMLPGEERTIIVQDAGNTELEIKSIR